MTESTFQKLTKLGYQFWSRKGFNNNSTETTPLTYILKDKLLIIGNKNEFDTYPRVLPSIVKILGLTKHEITQVSEVENLPYELDLVINFSENRIKKGKKNIKFDSLKVLMSDNKLKETFIKELQEIKL
tara:strand:- start:971 stop:1357 length:387 start_codon:yes stop_codon:yes gene_type:complete